MESELSKLFNTLNTNKINVGTYDSFVKKMQTPWQRKSFYDNLFKNGFNLGDYDVYEKRLSESEEITSRLGTGYFTPKEEEKIEKWQRQLIEHPAKELSLKAARGTDQSGIMLTGIPRGIGRASYAVSSLIPWEKMGLPGPDPDPLGGGIVGRVVDKLERKIEMLNEVSGVKPEMNTRVTDNIVEKKYGRAAINILGNVLEATPVSLLMGVPAARGANLAQSFSFIALSTGTMIAEENLKDPDLAHLPPSQRIGVGLLNGLPEAAFETIFGAGPTTKVLVDAVKGKALKEGEKQLAKTFSAFIMKLYAKSPLWAMPLGNAFEEMGTGMAQNFIDKFMLDRNVKIMDGVVDEGIIGFFQASGTGVTAKMAHKFRMQRIKGDMMRQFNEAGMEIDEAVKSATNKQTGNIIIAVDTKGNEFNIIDDIDNETVAVLNPATNERLILPRKDLTISSEMSPDDLKAAMFQRLMAQQADEYAGKSEEIEQEIQQKADEEAMPDIEIGETINYNGKDLIVDHVDVDHIVAVPEDGDISKDFVIIPADEVQSIIAQRQAVQPEGEAVSPEAVKFRAGDLSFEFQKADDGSYFTSYTDPQNINSVIEQIKKEVDTDKYDVIPVTEQKPIEGAAEFAKKKTQEVALGIRIQPKVETTQKQVRSEKEIEKTTERQQQPESEKVEQERSEKEKEEITYHGTDMKGWQAILNKKKSPQFATSDRASAIKAVDGGMNDIIVEFKPEAKAKMKEVSGDLLSAEKLTLDDVQRVVDKDGKVLYEAKKAEAKKTETPKSDNLKAVLNKIKETESWDDARKKLSKEDWDIMKREYDKDDKLTIKQIYERAVDDAIGDKAPTVKRAKKPEPKKVIVKKPEARKAKKKTEPRKAKPQIKKKVAEQAKSIEGRAKKHYGVTNNFEKAGYLLTDGSLLDFAEGSDARTLDHRDISSVDSDVDITSFMARGNIRLSPEGPGFEVTRMPTTGQINALKRFIRSNNGYVYVDFSKLSSDHTEFSVEYKEGTSADKVISDIANYYKKGILPINRISFKKSAISQGAGKANVDRLGFYSNLENALGKIQMNKGTPQQWLAEIRKNGGRQNELNWIMFDDFIKDKKTLTKQELIDFINENKVQLSEEALPVVDNKGEVVKDVKWARQRALKGGSNYFERLITLVKRGAKYISSHYAKVDNLVAHVRGTDRVTTDNKKLLTMEEIQSDWAQEGRRLGFDETDSEYMRVKKYLDDNKEAFKKLDRIANYLKEDVSAVAKLTPEQREQRILERHEEVKRESLRDKALEGIDAELNYDKYNESLTWFFKQEAKVPDMPFKSTDQWVALTVRRMLMEASSKGYDGLSWATGEQNAIANQKIQDASKIIFSSDGSLHIIRKSDSKNVLIEENITKENLSDYVGKAIADEILKQKPDSDGALVLSNIDTKVSNNEGRGMVYFYNNIVRKVVDKEASKFGVKSEMIDVETEPGKFEKVFYIPITDQMRASVLEGMPMFKIADVSPTYVGQMLKGMKANQVANVLKKLNELKSLTKSKVNVIEKQSDLPDFIKRQLGPNELVKGVHVGGVNYVVVENLASLNDAVGTFIHEVGVHEGLVKIIPDDASRKRFCERIVDEIGVDEIGRVVPESEMSLEKHLLGEEYIAYLAEKHLDGKTLTIKEKTIWQKFIDFVNSSLRKLGFNIKLTESDILTIAKQSIESNISMRQVDPAVRQTIDQDIHKKRTKDSDKARPAEPGVRFAGELLNIGKADLRFSPEVINKLNQIRDEYNSLSDTDVGVIGDLMERSRPGKVNQRLGLVTDYLTEGLRELGYNSLYAVRAESGAAYIYKDGSYRGESIRISDSPGRGGILDPSINVSDMVQAEQLLRDTESVQDVQRKAEADKARIADNKLFTDSEFRDNDLTYGKIDRTNKSFEEIKKENPGWKHIKQTALGEDASGKMAYRYEYLKDMHLKDKYSEYIPESYTNWYRQSKDQPDVMFKKKKPPIFIGEEIQMGSERYAENKKRQRTWNEVATGMREFWQDINLPVRRLRDAIIERGGTEKDNSKPYRDIFLAFGRQEKLYSDFIDKGFKPIVTATKTMMDAGVQQYDILTYVISKAGYERNIRYRAAEIEKWKQDRADEGYTAEELADFEKSIENKDYSGVGDFDPKKKTGMTPDQLALKITEDFERAVDKKLVDELWSSINNATSKILDIWVESKEISPKQRDELKKNYKYYVPLRGWREGAAKELFYTKGEGFAPSYQKAEGRKTLADNPFAYIQKIGFDAVAEQIDAEVRNSMLNLVYQNLKVGIDDIVEIKKQYYVKNVLPNGEHEWIPVLDKPPAKMFADGRAKTKIYNEYERLRSPRQAREHEVIVRRGNDDVVLVFKNKYLSVAQALNRQNFMYSTFWGTIADARELNNIAIKTGMAAMTNFLKAAYTSYNIVFPFTNFMRDFQEASLNQLIRGEHGHKIVSNYTHAFPAIIRYLTGRSDVVNNPIDAKLSEFYEVGGATGHTRNRTIEQLEKRLNRDIRRMMNRGTVTGNMENAAVSLLRGVEAWNMIFEDATRFSVYITSLDLGKTSKDAAFDAKEASINFNRRGKSSRFFDSVYAFWNVSVQELQKNVRMARTRPKAFVAVASSWVALGYLEAMMNYYTDDPDDPEGWYYNISPWMRQNYLIIPNLPKKLIKGDKGDKYLSIPLAQFWRGFKGMGALAFDITVGKTTAKDAMIQSISNFGGAMTPIDIGGFWETGKFSVAPLVPTIIQPLHEIAINRDFMGVTIAATPFTKQQEKMLADKGMGKKNVNHAAKFFTDLLFRWGGGDNESKYYVDVFGKEHKVPGFMDINPSYIEHLFKGYTGGTGGVIADMITTAVQMIDPEEGVNFRNMPFVNRFIRQTPEHKWTIIREYYDLKDKTGVWEELLRQYRRQANEGDKTSIKKYEQLMTDPYINEYINAYKYHDKEITSLKKTDVIDEEQLSKLITDEMSKCIDKVEKLKIKYNKK